ncbi:hypothetical protein [Enterococcus faecium]|uniref:hypothetical protein n=1 Tax=Enterococcus faecium TaxID=1352 RepID=UPI000CF277E9|nr:hypothetical protein [Enterococcus faecium]EGP4986486.1 hypothetical protein [Enterococcus faecium]EGP5140855.1 hypothetical protein [Enterococcus faecium]EME7167156.1 hypothetical protein [Enterococcus faecium]PQE60291.1 hypothetical protein CUS10_12760 [Enterococcus faecium]
MNYMYYPLGDGFKKNINLRANENLVDRYEKDILQKIAKQKDKQLLVAKYVADFNTTEKRCFLGLLKRFVRVKVVYRQEDGISRQYLISA